MKTKLIKILMPFAIGFGIGLNIINFNPVGLVMAVTSLVLYYLVCIPYLNGCYQEDNHLSELRNRWKHQKDVTKNLSKTFQKEIEYDYCSILDYKTTRKFLNGNFDSFRIEGNKFPVFIPQSEQFFYQTIEKQIQLLNEYKDYIKQFFYLEGDVIEYTKTFQNGDFQRINDEILRMTSAVGLKYLETYLEKKENHTTGNIWNEVTYKFEVPDKFDNSHVFNIQIDINQL